jgi:hypothetical protein
MASRYHTQATNKSLLVYSFYPTLSMERGARETEKLLAVMEWLAGVASFSEHCLHCEEASRGIPIDRNPIDIKWQ